MFWRKPTKASDITISGRFSLGEEGGSTSRSPNTGEGIPSNSDALAPREMAPGLGIHPFPLSITRQDSLEGSLVPSPRKDLAMYVVPRGYRISSHTFVPGLIRVDGELAGRSVSAHSVLITEGGSVSAPIDAVFVKVAGSVTSSVEARAEVEILASGKIQGSVTTSQMYVESGARVLSPKLLVG